MSARRSIVLPVTSTTTPRTRGTCRLGRPGSPTKTCSWSMVSGSSTRQWDAVVVAFAAANDFGILDHDVTVAIGETVRNPMRVMANGDGCDVVFTVRRRPGMSETDLAADVDAVTADLAALRTLLEHRRTSSKPH